MKPLYYTCILVLLASAAVFSQTRVLKEYRLSENLSVTELDSATFLAVHSFPYAANTLVLKFAGGHYLWANTTYTDEAAALLYHWLQSRDSATISVTAINTHFHIDNLGGNGFLISKGAEVYGPDLSVELLKDTSRHDAMLSMLKDPKMAKYFEYYRNVRYVPPAKTFPLKEGMTLQIDGQTIEVWYPGPGHTTDNVVVYYPAKGLLFGGCLLKSMDSRSRGNIADADLARWPASLTALAKKYPDAKLVIPGHGAPGGFDLIKHTLEIVR